MNPRHYSLIAAIVFTVLAALQLARAVFGWPVTVTTQWGAIMVPIWPSGIACAVALVLAFIGFTASRS